MTSDHNTDRDALLNTYSHLHTQVHGERYDCFAGTDHDLREAIANLARRADLEVEL